MRPKWPTRRSGGRAASPSRRWPNVRDTCSTNGITITPDTPLDKVKEVVRGTFDADIAIWGSVERVAGTEGEIYDIKMKCVDFTGSSEPKVLYDKSARTNAAAEIPHLYTKDMLNKLYGREPGGPPPPDETAERAWKVNPNLIVGGDFEYGSRGVPRGWEPRGGQRREPLGNLVKWVPENGNPKNHVIRFDIPRAVAENEGVMYYSDFFPVQEGSKYRFQVRYRTTGPSPKVFIKCYDEMASDYRAEGACATSPPPAPCSAARSTAASRISRARRTSGTPRPRTSLPSTPSTIPSGARSCSTVTSARARSSGTTWW